MKKILFAILLIATLAGAYIFINKLYYPPLPIDTISKKEVLDRLHQSDEKIVFLTTENGKEWFIIDERNQVNRAEIMTDMLQNYGWAYIEQMGSGLFFEKQDEKLIVTTQKWTRNYSLVDIPINYK